MPNQQTQCPSCQNKLLGQYCHQCGEKQFSKQDLSAAKVVNHAISAVTDVDGKWLKTFKLLVTQPGALTVFYLSGIRKKLLTPFKLVLICSIKFFLIAGILGYSAFTTPLETHLNAENFIHHNIAQEMVSTRLNKTGEASNDFADRFNETAELQARTLVMLMVPLFALVVLVLHPKQLHPLISSMVFATHVFAFMLLFQALVGPVVLQVVVFLMSLEVAGNNHFNATELVYSLVMFFSFGWYFFLASRRIYANSVSISIIKALIFSCCVYWVFIVYRMILFFTTFYSI